MIDEKKLIAELEEWRKALVLNAGIYGEGIEAIIDVAIQKVRSQPEVSGWIPMEKRRPEDRQEVWISTNTMYVEKAIYAKTSMGDKFYGENTRYALDMVKAWRPYTEPDPYRPEKLKEADSAAADKDTLPEAAREHLMQRFTKVM